MNDRLGTRFDHEIYQYIKAPVREVYSKVLQKTETNMVEMELSLNDIKERMLLSRDVKSGTGLILLPKGTTLNWRNIQALRRYYQLDPSETGIFVLVKR